MVPALVFISAFLGNMVLIPVIRMIGIKLRVVAEPRPDRWHNHSTPTLGGIAIFLAFLLPLISISLGSSGIGQHTSLLFGASLMFLLGLYDDVKRLSPPTKLLGQIFITAIMIFQGYQTKFFTPKIANPLIADFPNLLLTVIWIIGITNAINLIDNMDGLAGGISFIAAGFLGFFFWMGGDSGLLLFAAALCGSLLSFLIFNFPPARIFMGDSGSLFLGFTLAILAITRAPQASNVFAVMGVPTLLFLLPILDTSFVTLTRLLRGQSPAVGGRDHTSHRLVAFGLTERQVLMVLYGVALLSGLAGIALETLDYRSSLVFIPILVISLALMAAYLGRLKIVLVPTNPPPGRFSRIIIDLTYRRRVLEIILDFVIIGLAYYFAFWSSQGFKLPDVQLDSFLNIIPIAYGGTYLSFALFGVYRGVWRYVSVRDLIRFAQATIGSVVWVWLCTWLFTQDENIQPMLLALTALFLFVGLAASRSSFRIFDQVFGRQAARPGSNVVIIGTGDEGEMAVRWIDMNPEIGYHVIGIIGDDPNETGRQIHSVLILGGLGRLDKLLTQKGIDGVIITGERLSQDQLAFILELCRANQVWVRKLRLEFEPVEEIHVSQKKLYS